MQPKDPISKAIAAVEQPKPIEMRQFNITISSTGRPAIVAFPADATDGEIAELCGGILSSILATIRQEREARSPIQIVRAFPKPTNGA